MEHGEFWNMYGKFIEIDKNTLIENNSELKKELEDKNLQLIRAFKFSPNDSNDQTQQKYQDMFNILLFATKPFSIMSKYSFEIVNFEKSFKTYENLEEAFATALSVCDDIICENFENTDMPMYL